MTSNRDKLLWLFSPLNLNFVSLGIAIFVWLLPSQLYPQVLQEKSYYSYNFLSLFWILLCSFSFLLGICLFRSIHIKFSTKKVNWRGVYRIIPLMIVSSIISLVIIIYSLGGLRNYIDIVSQFGSDYNRIFVYNALKSAGVGWVPQGLFPFVACSSYLIFLHQGYKKLYFSILPLLYLLIISPSQTKASLLSFIMVILFSYLISRTRTTNKERMKSILLISAVIIVAVAIFIAMQSVKQGRDFSTVYGILKELMGYGPASYNRLAALLNHNLYLPNSLMGYYTNTWYWNTPGVSNINNLLESIGFSIPHPSFDNWLDTFSYIKDSGLNQNFIWVTAYGEAFADYGFFGAIWFLVYGFFSEAVWHLLLLDRIYIAIYAVFLVAGLQWYATASIGSKSVVFSVIAILIIKFLSALNIRGGINE